MGRWALAAVATAAVLAAACGGVTTTPWSGTRAPQEDRLQLVVFGFDGDALWPTRPRGYEEAMEEIAPMAEERELLRITETAVGSHWLDRRTLELNLNAEGRERLLAAGVPLDADHLGALRWFEGKGFLLTVDGRHLLAGEGSSILSARGFDVPVLFLDLDRERAVLEITLSGSDDAILDDQWRLRRFGLSGRLDGMGVPLDLSTHVLGRAPV